MEITVCPSGYCSQKVELKLIDAFLSMGIVMLKTYDGRRGRVVGKTLSVVSKIHTVGQQQVWVGTTSACQVHKAWTICLFVAGRLEGGVLMDPLHNPLSVQHRGRPDRVCDVDCMYRFPMCCAAFAFA